MYIHKGDVLTVGSIEAHLISLLSVRQTSRRWGRKVQLQRHGAEGQGCAVLVAAAVMLAAGDGQPIS